MSTQADRKPVYRFIPLSFQWETRDPFLFCVHHEDHYPRGNGSFGPAASLQGRPIGMDFEPRDGWRMYHGETVPGFPAHPHRGFETVTVVQRGFVDHADSQGAAGRYGGGDVQWMTAGRGLQHSEMFPLLSNENENTLELFQIWLNLPARRKMSEPAFKMLWSEDIPVLREQDSSGHETRVILYAGGLAGLQPPAPAPDSWAADPDNHVAIWNIIMPAGGQWTLPAAPAALNRRLYLYRGSGLRLNDSAVPDYHAVDLASEVPVSLHAAGSTEVRLLLLQGRPINEPVAQHGPFVMNSPEEIQRAFLDFRSTGFGGWPWKGPDPVHGAELRRFARYADGREESRPVE